MTVRTEKIQALTGSAPLTLPSSLPTSQKGLQVSTTGVLTTPNVADSMTNLSSSVDSNPGWVLLDHVEQNSGTDTIEVSAEGNTAYPATDIYCYEVRFHLMQWYQRQTFAWRSAPMYNGTTYVNGEYRNRKGFGFGPTKNEYAVGSNGQGGSSANDYWTSISMCIGDATGGNDYAKQYDPSTASYANSKGGDGGAQGVIRFYNGSMYNGMRIDPVGLTYQESNGNSYNTITMSSSQSDMPYSGGSKYTGKLNGYRFFTDSTTRQIFGFVQLWGMPKTAT